MGNQQVDILVDSKNLETDIQIQRFYQALDEIKAARDVQLLPELFMVFDDNVARIESLQSLMTYIESFSVYELVDYLVDSTPQLVDGHGKDWIETFYCHILVHDEGIRYLRGLLGQVTEIQKNAVCHILKEIADDDTDPQSQELFKTKVNFVIGDLC